MERKRNIVESINAPQTHDLWIHNGELKYYGSSGWTPFDENVKEELSSLSETVEDISTQVNNITSTIRDIIPKLDTASTTKNGLMSATDKKNLDEVVSFNKEPANSPFTIRTDTSADILDTEVIMTLGQGDNKTNLWVVLIRCYEIEDQILQLEYNNEIISEKNYYYNSSSGNFLSELLLWTVSLPANAAQGSCSIHVS